MSLGTKHSNKYKNSGIRNHRYINSQRVRPPNTKHSYIHAIIHQQYTTNTFYKHKHTQLIHGITHSTTQQTASGRVKEPKNPLCAQKEFYVHPWQPGTLDSSLFYSEIHPVRQMNLRQVKNEQVLSKTILIEWEVAEASTELLQRNNTKRLQYKNYSTHIIIHTIQYTLITCRYKNNSCHTWRRWHSRSLSLLRAHCGHVAWGNHVYRPWEATEALC